MASVETELRGMSNHRKNRGKVSRNQVSPLLVSPRVAFLLTINRSKVLTGSVSEEAFVGSFVLKNLVGAGRIELPTSWSQTRRPTAGPRPESG